MAKPTGDAQRWRRVITWDYRQQPDLDVLATAVRELSDDRVHITTVDTNSDQYAIVVSRGRLSPVSALAAYNGEWSQ